eukprot:306952-Prymnesium_polylepis.1
MRTLRAARVGAPSDSMHARGCTRESIAFARPMADRSPCPRVDASPLHRGCPRRARRCERAVGEGRSGGGGRGWAA